MPSEAWLNNEQMSSCNPHARPDTLTSSPRSDVPIISFPGLWLEMIEQNVPIMDAGML